jgi:hypothetical protein
MVLGRVLQVAWNHFGRSTAHSAAAMAEAALQPQSQQQPQDGVRQPGDAPAAAPGDGGVNVDKASALSSDRQQEAQDADPGAHRQPAAAEAHEAAGSQAQAAAQQAGLRGQAAASSPAAGADAAARAGEDQAASGAAAVEAAAAADAATPAQAADSGAEADSGAFQQSACKCSASAQRRGSWLWLEPTESWFVRLKYGLADVRSAAAAADARPGAQLAADPAALAGLVNATAPAQLLDQVSRCHPSCLPNDANRLSTAARTVLTPLLQLAAGMTGVAVAPIYRSGTMGCDWPCCSSVLPTAERICLCWQGRAV